MLIICSYLGNYGGGHALVEDWHVMVVLAVVNLFVMILAMKFKRSPEEVKADTEYL